MAAVDPVTGDPIGDYLVDPNVAGSSEEVADIDGTTNEAPSMAPTRDRSKPSVRIHIDTSDPDWLDKVGEAYSRAAEALGLDLSQFEGKAPILLKGDPSIMPKGFIDQRDEFTKKQDARRKK